MSLKTAVLVVIGLVLLPVVWSSGAAVYGYFAGTATIDYAGYPGPSGFNLDPATRIPLAPRGCTLGTAQQLLTHVPNNLTLDLLAVAFGPMRGTYHGPYPSSLEANAAVGAATALWVHPAVARSAALGDLAAPSCQALADDHRYDGEPWPVQPPPAERCAEFQGETLLLTVEDRIALLERRTGKRYGMYLRRREPATSP